MNKELIKLELTNYELAVVTAMVMSLREDSGEEIFDDLEGKAKEIAKEAFTGLLLKVLMANMQHFTTNGGAMDAEILAEGTDE